jgi:hypothetical protein
MVTTMRLSVTSCHYLFLCVVRTLKIESPSLQEAEAGGSQVCSLPGLHSETLSLPPPQKNNQPTKETNKQKRSIPLANSK